MPPAIALRSDFTAGQLREFARHSRDASQTLRLLALAAIYDGGTRSEAARLGHVTLQIVRDWVLRFKAEGLKGLVDRKAPGPTPLLSDEHRVALTGMIERGPAPAIHGVVRWRLYDLGQWLWEEFRVSVSVQTLSRELRAIGYRKLSARPKHLAGQHQPAAADAQVSGASVRRRYGRRPHRQTGQQIRLRVPSAIAGAQARRGCFG